MRTIANVLAMSACVFLVGTPSAFADQVSDELAEMRAAVEQLRGQVEAQSEQIAHQGEVIREARIERAAQSESRFGASGITAFLQRLQVDGHLSGSYFWNFNEPGSSTQNGLPGGVGPFSFAGGNVGMSGNVYPFHTNHNSFQVDQIWFGIEHPVDTENRAGFRFDLVYGATACALGNSVPFRCGFPGIQYGDNTSQYYVNQAYVQYLIPFTSNGVLVKAGRWNTIVGAEVAKATDNYNVTRGALYSMMQPIDHVGVIFSSDFGESGWSGAFGVMNDDQNGFLSNSDPDRNASKSIAFQVGWAGETISVTSSLLWGPSMAFSDNHAGGLYDLVITWDPTDKISTWLNFDLGWTKNKGPNSHAWGIAGAGRYAVTERMGISTRLEFLADDDGWFGYPSGGNLNFCCRSAQTFTVTGTLDYALSNSLMVRGEVRYDNVSKKNSIDNEFFEKGNQFTPDQVTMGAEIVYAF